MRKKNSFIKFLKSTINIINNLLEKNLNKLKFDNLKNILSSNKIVLTFVAVFILVITYLLLPTFYNQNEVSKELRLELLNKYNLKFQFSKKLDYNFFPRPHFINKDSVILEDKNIISNIKNLKIFISPKTLFSLKNLEIQDVVIEEANFNISEKNYKFFINLIKNNSSGSILNIKNSKVFYRNKLDEVLFINKIFRMKCYYDDKELKNKIISKNEIFNLPYEIELFDDSDEKKIFFKLDFNLFKIRIENKLSYENDLKIGEADLNINKSASKINYEINKKFIKFDLFDKKENPSYLYEGNFNLNPFYSTFEGKTQQLNLSYLLNPNSYIVQLLKTEIINKKNVDFELNVDANKIFNNIDFQNLKLNSKIKEGLIDIDGTIFKWKNFVDFKLTDSLIFVKDGELFLDGRLVLNINNHKEIYKYLLTPKKFRKEINKVEFNFSYNIDQKIAKLSGINVDEKYNQNVNKILDSLIFKENNLQNKIYLKNLLNAGIKSYSG